MSNKLYSEFGANQNGSNNNFLNTYGNVLGFLKKTGGNPKQMVNQLLSSGKMSKEQFDQYSQIANTILGRK